MTARPRISILLPCRDSEGTLAVALSSLHEQTFEDFEIVAVDDGSADHTFELLETWARRDHRIRIQTTAPYGIVSALNTAAGLAEGELLARMDADDVAAPRRFELQAGLLDAQPELAACGTLVRYFPRSILRDGARRYEEWINSVVTAEQIERDLFIECPIPHPTLVMRRDAFERAGGYRDIGWPEDYDLVLRWWELGYRMAKVEEQLLHWRESPERLSRVDSRYSEQAFRRCKAAYLGKRLSGRSIVVCGAGPIGKAFALALQEEAHSIAAFVDLDPRKIGQVVHGAPVVHPDMVADYEGCYFVAAVGSRKGREEIRDMLSAKGFKETEEFCAVA